MARYDRYDRWREPAPFTGWYPGAFWAGAPMYGWDGMAARPPAPGRGYDARYAGPRRRPIHPIDRMRYDRDHYDPRGARRYDDRYERVWDRWW